MVVVRHNHSLLSPYLYPEYSGSMFLQNAESVFQQYVSLIIAYTFNYP